MAAIFQLRRGSGSVSLVDGELYLHKGSGSLQVSLGDGNPITLARLNQPNSGSLNVGGDITASNAYFSGDVSISGNLFLGNASNDNISVPGVFTTNLVPGTNGTLDLGTNGAKWNTIYANSVTASISGNINNINITELSESVNFQLVSIYQTTASLNDFSASVTASLEKLYESTASLNDFSASVTASLVSIYQTTSSLNDFSASVTTSLQSIYQTTSSLNDFSASVTTSLVSIYQTTASLNIHSASVDNKFNDLAIISSSLITTTSLHEQRLGDIQSYTSSLKTAIELTGSSVTILGNLNVRGTTTTVDSTTIQIGDNIIELNGAGTANAGIIVKDTTNPSLESGSLIYDTTTNYWKAGIWSSESKILLAGGDNVFTSSLQLTELNSTTASLNQTTESLNSFSGSVTTSLEKLYESTASLNLFSASVTASLEKLYESTASLNNFTASITGGVNKIGYFNTEKSLTSYINSYLGSQTFGLGTNATSSGAPERLMVDNSGENSYNIATFQTSKQDSYAQVNIKNFGSGSSSSTDLILWNDVSTESSSYLDLGINSSNYSAGNVGYGGDAYLYNAANDLYIGSISTGSHGHVHLFGGNQWQSASITIYGDGTIGVNTDKLNNNATTIPTSGYVMEISGGVVFDNDIDVIGNISSSTISGMGNVSQFVTSIQSSTSSLILSASSFENRFGTLGNVTSSFEGRFTTLAQVTASIHEFTSSLNTYTGATEIRLDELEYTASISVGAGLAAEFTKLNQFTASADMRLDALEAYSASYSQYFIYSGSEFHIDFNL